MANTALKLLLLAILSTATTVSGRVATRETSRHQEVQGKAYGVVITSTDEKNCLSLRETNRLIASSGKAKLRGDYRMNEAAVEQCTNMAIEGSTQHYTFNTMPSDRVLAAGYNYQVSLVFQPTNAFLKQTVAENIASESFKGESDPVRAVHLWWNSPGHRKNMLGPYSVVGYASCLGVSDGRIYYAHVLGYGDPNEGQEYSEETCGFHEDLYREAAIASPGDTAGEPVYQAPAAEYPSEAEVYEYEPVVEAVKPSLPRKVHTGPCVATYYGVKSVSKNKRKKSKASTEFQ